MKQNLVWAAIAAISVAGGVLAHGGATGIVKERMDGMVALGKAVKAITPMMMGQETYDADKVVEFGASVRAHSGEALTKLFPEGSGGMLSEAKENVWSDWDEFAALADYLERLGEGIEQAATNGVGAGSSAGMGQGMMSGSNSMMGGSTGMTGETTGMMGGGTLSEMMSLDMIAQMPADRVFTMISQTCSACHTKFRAEGN